MSGKVHKSNVWVDEFIQEIDKAYAAADIVISRAGAMSVAEMCVAGKPTVFVPYPYASEDHQTENAMRLIRKDAGAMVADSEAATKLFSTVTDILFDENKLKTFQENIKKLAVTNANEIIAEEILKTVQ